MVTCPLFIGNIPGKRNAILKACCCNDIKFCTLLKEQMVSCIYPNILGKPQRYHLDENISPLLAFKVFDLCYKYIWHRIYCNNVAVSLYHCINLLNLLNRQWLIDVTEHEHQFICSKISATLAGQISSKLHVPSSYYTCSRYMCIP